MSETTLICYEHPICPRVLLSVSVIRPSFSTPLELACREADILIRIACFAYSYPVLPAQTICKSHQRSLTDSPLAS